MQENFSLPDDLRNDTFISFLDMSRWMAAAIVFLSHLRNPLFLSYGDVAADDRNLLVQGWYFVTGWFPEGVIVFFVLSGLLVGGSGVIKLQSKIFSLKNYSIDRVSRLYVALIPALILGIVMDKVGIIYFSETGFWDHSHPMINQKIASEPFQEKISFNILISNILMLQHYFSPTLGSNDPLWTISSEFWFYFMFGVFTLFANKKNIIKGIALVICVLAFYFLGIKFLILFGYWVIGVLAGIYNKRILLSPLVSAAIFFLILIISRAYLGGTTPSSSLIILKNYFVAAAFAVLILSIRRKEISFFKRTKSFNKFFADFSYSLYLIHFPSMLFFLALLSYFGVFSGIESGYRPTSLEGIGIYFLVIILVYFSAYIFSIFTEKKTHIVKSNLKKTLEKF